MSTWSPQSDWDPNVERRVLIEEDEDSDSEANDMEENDSLLKSDAPFSSPSRNSLSPHSAFPMKLFAGACVLMVAVALVFSRSRSAPSAFATTTGTTSTVMDQLRMDLASVSIDMMKSDTNKAAEESNTVDIGPLYEVLDRALDTVGVRGMYMELFETYQFLVALRKVANSKGLYDLMTAVEVHPGKHQPDVMYYGIPNDRKINEKDRHLCFGCIWWLRHYAGIVTAHKLQDEGSLLLDPGTQERLYDAVSFMKELHRMQMLPDADVVVFHASHGFVWHWIATTMPDLDEYPLEVADAFCGEYRDKEFMNSNIHEGVSMECWHSFGHALYFTFAMRQLGKYDIRKSFRPSGGFVLDDEAMCKGYKYCTQGYDGLPLKECRGGLHHSYRLYRPESNMSKKIPSSAKQRRTCAEMNPDLYEGI